MSIKEIEIEIWKLQAQLAYTVDPRSTEFEEKTIALIENQKLLIKALKKELNHAA